MRANWWTFYRRRRIVVGIFSIGLSDENKHANAVFFHRLPIRTFSLGQTALDNIIRLRRRVQDLDHYFAIFHHVFRWSQRLLETVLGFNEIVTRKRVFLLKKKNVLTERIHDSRILFYLFWRRNTPGGMGWGVESRKLRITRVRKPQCHTAFDIWTPVVEQEPHLSYVFRIPYSVGCKNND